MSEEIILSFYDHARQAYANQEIRGASGGAVSEFMVGNYADEGGVGYGSEFRILLYRFDQSLHIGAYFKPLAIEFQVFTEALPAFREFDSIGALAAIESADVFNNRDLTRILVTAGLKDRSDFGDPPTICDRCNGKGLVPG